VTDGGFWRHCWLAFTKRRPYDPTGRDQEIARLQAEINARDPDRFLEAVKAIRRWCIDISRDATANNREDLRRVIPEILDELDRAISGEPLQHAGKDTP
jgi:hypothetical protein